MKISTNKILIIILFLTLAVRLYHITFPLIGWHSWRQTDKIKMVKFKIACKNENRIKTDAPFWGIK